MQLSKSLKTFSQHYPQFVQCPSNFKRFEKKKMRFIADAFPKLQTVKYMVRRMFGEPRFRPGLDNEHVKASHTLMKSE